MHALSLATVAAIAATTLSAGAAQAFVRPSAEAGPGIVIRAADLDGAHGPSRVGVPWRYRAAYTRWLHNEYVRAGYPVRHHCGCGRRW